MTSRPLGAYVRGSSAWILWQVLHEPLRARIRQLEVDPGVPGDVVRHLRGTAADLEEAARQYREVACSASESAELRFPRFPGGSRSWSDWAKGGADCDQTEQVRAG